MDTADIDVEVSVLRVSALDDLTAGPPEVSTMNLRIPDVLLGRATLEREFTEPCEKWVIDHDFDTWFVDVHTYDSDGAELIGDVAIVDSDRVVVHWAKPTAGVARLVGGG